MTYVKKSDIISIYNPAGDEPQPDWFKEALKNGKIQITTISLSTDPPYIKEEYSIENLHLGTMSHGLRDRHAFARDCYGNIWFIELELLDKYQPIALVKKYDKKKNPAYSIRGPYGTAFDVKLDESIGKVELKAQEN